MPLDGFLVVLAVLEALGRAQLILTQDDLALDADMLLGLLISMIPACYMAVLKIWCLFM